MYLFTQSLIIKHHPSTPKEDYRICGQNPMVLQFKTNLLYLSVLCISNAVSTFEFVFKIRWCDHSNEISSAVPLHGTI